MKVGLVADVHANGLALRAVADELARQDVDVVLMAGDFVGYYLDVNEVIDEIRERRWLSIRGNHDDYALGALQPDASREPSYRSTWTASALAEQNRAWLGNLPSDRTLSLGGRSILLCHGSPWHADEYVYPDRADWSAFDALDVDVVVMGHTHHPLVRRARRALLLNPGSCGQPRDWDPRASFMTLNLDTLEPEIHRVAYDVEALQAMLRRKGLGDDVVNILSRRRAS